MALYQLGNMRLVWCRYACLVYHRRDNEALHCVQSYGGGGPGTDDDGDDDDGQRQQQHDDAMPTAVAVVAVVVVAVAVAATAAPPGDDDDAQRNATIFEHYSLASDRVGHRHSAADAVTVIVVAVSNEPLDHHKWPMYANDLFEKPMQNCFDAADAVIAVSDDNFESVVAHGLLYSNHCLQPFI